MDLFDALTSERPYKEAWGCRKPSGRSCAAGGHFDTKVVDAFLSVLPEQIAIQQRLRAGKRGIAGIAEA